MEELGIIGALALELIKLLTPNQRKLLTNKINELDEDYEKKRQEFLKAVESGNTAKLNQLIGKYLL